MNSLSSFSIQNPRQISSYLSLLLKHRCLLCARFGENGESYITTLLGMDEKNNTLILDYGSQDYINHQLLHARQVTFDGEFRGIKISFSVTALKKITHNKEPAFSISFPESLFWMARREYYRVKIPLLKPSYCQLILNDSDPVSFKLYDISLSGFSMLNADHCITHQINPNISLAQCKLLLSGTGEYEIPVETRYSHIINPDKPQKIGCKFITTTPSFEDVIQGYMQRVQREELQGHVPIPEENLRHRTILIFTNYE